ncbi:E3 ubiquitin-protein ligase siah2-like [Anoplophora glabripennis]|uniref:E3 ubiquitin-protein ligase siah2-like n=1 Tax=Anoplophora glabripennis TaxID=217634 RepID=UPI0008754D00|nr:E3 ubiquitin-protein ligase siah2-like [Anoplophora glabripennis]
MDVLMTPEDLLMELECPICYMYISAPVRQCCNLHAMCATCFNKVDKCPVCRQPKIPTRNHVLEKLYSVLDIPCQYRHEGCDSKVKGIHIKSHEGICVYRSVPCPLSFLQDCLWAGPESKIEQHCRESHYLNVIFGTEASLIVTNFTDGASSMNIILIYAYNKFFYVYWDIDMDIGEMRFYVTFQGFSEDNDRFSYRIRFIRKKMSRVARSFFGRCRSDDTFLLVPGGTVSINFDHVKDYCRCDGSLEFFLKLTDNFADDSNKYYEKK